MNVVFEPQYCKTVKVTHMNGELSIRVNTDAATRINSEIQQTNRDETFNHISFIGANSIVFSRTKTV